jgi:hypothetical protein
MVNLETLENITGLVVNVCLLIVAGYTLYKTTFCKKMYILGYHYNFVKDKNELIFILVSRSLMVLFIKKVEVVLDKQLIIELYNYNANDSEMKIVNPMGTLKISSEWFNDLKSAVDSDLDLTKYNEAKNPIEVFNSLTKSNPKADVDIKECLIKGNYYLYITFNDNSISKIKQKKKSNKKIEEEKKKLEPAILEK